MSKYHLDASSGAIANTRLTWLAGSVAPYESAWSVFARVMATNYLTWKELRLLVASSTLAATSGSAFLSAHGIALDRYAAMLGECRDVLETGFLDTLGFPASLLGTRGIRHCPACATAGYHCTLFSLGALTHCPWHRVRLTQSCVRCASAVRTMDPRNLSETITCPACGTRIVDSAYRIGGVSDQGIRQAAQECCTEITSWWRAIRDKERVANELIGDALGAEVAEKHGYQIALKWGAVYALSMPPECWVISTSATPATIVRWTGRRCETENDPETEQMLIVRRYRSVRRQIFRKFVRPHRQCLSFLTSTKRINLIHLDREQACTVCLAFIAWRFAIEQDIDEIVQSRGKMKDASAPFPRSEVFQSKFDHPSVSASSIDRSVRHWKLRMPTLDGSLPSADLVPRLLYAEFLRIWMELEVGHIDANLRVLVESWGPRSPPLPIVESTSACGSGADATVPNWTVVLPDAEVLARQAWERCTQRKLHWWYMLDWQEGFNTKKFTWRKSAPSGLLFKLRYFGARSVRTVRDVYA